MELTNRSVSNYSSSFSTSAPSSDSSSSSSSSTECLFTPGVSSLTWNSLSGYLLHQSNQGIFKFFRRQLWFELDELSCSLSGYKRSSLNETADAPASPSHTTASKPPSAAATSDAKSLKAKNKSQSSVHIELQCAGIFPAAVDACDFLIVSENIEHVFVAETKQSASIWIVALQASRTRYTSFKYATPINKLPLSIDKSEFWSNLNSEKRNRDRHLHYRSSVRSWGGRGSRCTQPQLDFSHPGKRSHSLDSFLHHGQYAESRDYPCDDMLNKQTSKLLRKDDEVNKYEELKRKNSNNLSDSLALTKNSIIDEHKDRALLLGLSNEEHSNIVQIVDLENQVLKSKSHIAKIFNKEHRLNSILEDRDARIVQLQDQINKLEHDKSGLSDHWTAQTKQLQAQVASLSCEVRRLAKQNSQLCKFMNQEKLQMEKIERSEASWKHDYVLLLQSCIPILPEHHNDQSHLSILNFNTHKKRICELLSEAKEINPSLPSYTSLRQEMCHVDQYYFRNEMDGENEMLHYICRQLQQHLRQAHPAQIGLIQRWRHLLNAPNIVPFTCHMEMKNLCREGIPNELRGEIWRRIVDDKVAKIKSEKGKDYFDHLYVQSFNPQFGGFCRKEINLDLLRTMPTNVNFCQAEAPGVKKLNELLQAFSLHSPDVGYCQGVNFLAAILLLFLNVEDAFWALVCITEVNFSCRYFDESLLGATVDQEVFQEMLAKKMPVLFRHLRSFEIEFPTITINWFITIFFEIVPFQTLLRIWDCFLFEGQKVLFRFALSILKINENILLKQRDSLSILRILKSSTKLIYDADQLVKTAFEDLKPFPSKHEIHTRQLFFVKMAEDKEMKRALDRCSPSAVSRQHKQRMLDYESLKSVGRLMHHSIAILPNDQVLLFLTSRQLSRVRLLLKNKYQSVKLDIQMNFQITAVVSWKNYVFISTLSKDIRCYVYNAGSLELISVHVVRCVALSMCINGLTFDPNKTESTFNLVAGLKDGHLAIIENALNRNLSSTSSQDAIYLPVSQHAISNVLKVEEHLWLSAGREIHILKSSSLNAVTRFKVSENIFDSISLLATLEDNGGRVRGVWVALDSCPFLQLFHPRRFNCCAVYDLATKKQLITMREDEYSSNSRVTALHVRDGETWVGSGEGAIFIIAFLRTPLKRYSKLPNSVENLFHAENGVFMEESIVRKTSSQSFSVELKSYVSTNDLIENLRKSITVCPTVTKSFETSTRLRRRSSLLSVGEMPDRRKGGRTSPISELPEFAANFSRKKRLAASMEHLADDPLPSGPRSALEGRFRPQSVDENRMSVDASFSVQLSLKQFTSASNQPIKCITSFRYANSMVGFCSTSGYFADDAAVQLWRYNNGADLWVSESASEKTDGDEQPQLSTSSESKTLKDALTKIENILFTSRSKN